MLQMLNALSFRQKFFKFLDAEMTTPKTFGWYHILWLAIVVGLCVVVVLFRKKISEKRYNQILLFTSIAMIALEIYKQLNFTYEWDTDTWDYSWYAFPYQFCSTPMYVMPLALLFRKKPLIRDACRAYLATYALFGGLVVMAYPSDVFISTIGINIQTMVHHGSMVVIGVLTWVSGKAKIEHKTMLYALPVFAALAMLALSANILWYAVGNEETFNMFYISPYYDCTLPLLDIVYKALPYPIFLILYLVGFSLAAYIMLLLSKLIQWIYKKCSSKRSKAQGETPSPSDNPEQPN